VASDKDSPINLADWPYRGHVKFRNITAGYTLDGDAVLSNVNLEAKPGQRVAIVGRSGSGKSSLAATLLRLTEKFEGQVIIDDVDIDTVDALELRQKICFIPQNPTFITGTLRFNLDFSGKVSDERLQQVVAEVTSGIGKKKEWTLDMEIAAEGMNLSQGERQLISLARALVTDARIVLIDEATASLDAESEEGIQRLLKERFSNKTLISIAHRLGPIAQYDWVCVMSRGRIIEQGDPKKLLAVEEGELVKLWRAVNS
jgi:ABC-type multidrug transport system fused ATPase/permease subunit